MATVRLLSNLLQPHQQLLPLLLLLLPLLQEAEPQEVRCPCSGSLPNTTSFG